MNIALTEIIKMVKEIPEKYLEETYKEVEKIKDKAQQEQSTKTEQCPHCSSMHIVRNGHKHHKQAFLCRTCKKSFVETTNTAIEHSHSSETVWKSVIRDTVKGVALTTTARNLAISPVTAFNMRHKILFTLEQETLRHPVELSGICETDETYVLESVKGRKIRDDYHRKARKHGAVAEKRGISNEYICVRTKCN